MVGMVNKYNAHHTDRAISSLGADALVVEVPTDRVDAFQRVADSDALVGATSLQLLYTEF